MSRMRLLLRLAVTAATARSTRAFYDRASSFYEPLFTDHLPHVQMMAAALAEEFPAKDRIKVLDLACGTGALTRQLDERGFCVTGLDFSLQSLYKLNQAARTVRLIQADAAALPVAPASFDVITCMGAWRHFPEPQRVLAEICRVLRPRGIFLVGYFPPKLGGLVSVPSGARGKAIVFLYGRLMRLLNYSDRTDGELERQTVRGIEMAFAKCRRIQSGRKEYLIFAESPR